MVVGIRKRIVEHRIADILILAIILVILSLATAYHLSDSPVQSSAPKTVAIKPELEVPAGFSLNDKIGQLLIIGVSSEKTAVSFEEHYQIGGFLLRPDSDLFSKNATDAIKKAGELTPLIAVDEEGGQVSRLPDSDFSKYSAKYMGGLPSSEVEKIGYDMGQAMTAIGANLDFAPVVDLDNGQNAAIAQLDRSFSSDPDTVAQKTAAFANGLRKAGVIPTFKHFPGLGNATGDTEGNTDTASATSPSISALEKADLLPYKTLLQTDALSAVMIGNQIVPGLSGGLPASLSANTYKLLREDYGYNQVTFTDELLLAKAVVSAEPSPSAAVIDAIKAGVDMPLIDTDDPVTLDSIIASVAAAVKSGQIKESQIDASLNRILLLKTSILHDS